jgi:signal transduction histidine kinase
MAKKTVLMHRGTIDVESQVGIGSTFTIVLPLTQKELSLTSNDSVKESN